MSSPDQPPSQTSDLPRLTSPAVSVVWSEDARRANSESRERSLFNRRAKRAIILCLKNAPPLHPALCERWPQLQSKSTVDISFVGDLEIQHLNAQYRGKPRPTDVLSFALWEGENDWPAHDELPLGDVVISIETAARQAVEHERETADEIAFLAIHGSLHLLGYDHDNATNRRRMWKQQNQLFEQLQSAPRKRAHTNFPSAPNSC